MTDQRTTSLTRIVGTLIPVLMITFVIVASWLFERSSTRDLSSLGYFSLPEPVAPAQVELLDMDGEAVVFPQPNGTKTIVFFGFTACPDVCPTTLSVINLALQHIESPPRVVMVSVDPARDTPERLHDYVQAFNPDFKALTGQEAKIRQLSDSLGVGFIQRSMAAGDYTVDHGAALVLLDQDGWHVGSIHPPHQPERLGRLFDTLL